MEKPIREISGIEREKWIHRNRYYYEYLVLYLKYYIPEGSSILLIGSGTGYLLEKLNPQRGVGIVNSPSQYEYAQIHRPKYQYHLSEFEDFEVEGVFDFVVICDHVGSFFDVQKVFHQMRRNCTDETRILITTLNFLWYPLLRLAEKTGLKMPQRKQNWLDRNDLSNLLMLEGFEVVAQRRNMLLPIHIPLISNFVNAFVAPLPLINQLGLVTFMMARKLPEKPQEKSVSVIIPARNERGNIEQLVLRTPEMGRGTEIIFVEGNSTDDTWAEVQCVGTRYQSIRNIKWIKQPGKGKGDAVRTGFDLASGDILMILDADMTVPPEDLPKFYEAIASGRGEFINGTRLVYPMENEAMRTLNLIGNKFFSLAFTLILNQPLKDTLCGTKVISRENYEKLIKNRSYFGEFDPFGDFDLLFGASKLLLKIVEVPIRYRARTYGSTNISRFRHGWILLKMTAFALSKIHFIRFRSNQAG